MTKMHSVGVGVVAVSLSLLVHPLAGLVVAVGYIVVRRSVRKASLRRRQLRLDSLTAPTIDRLALALSSGLSVPMAVEAVGRTGSDEIAERFKTAASQIAFGEDVVESVERIGAPINTHLDHACAQLTRSVHTGVSVGNDLRRIADAARDESSRRADARARRASVQMLMPLVMCILPAFGVLVIVPSLVVAINSMSW